MVKYFFVEIFQFIIETNLWEVKISFTSQILKNIPKLRNIQKILVFSFENG